MAQKPLDQMAHRPGKMGEDAEYILSELKPLIHILEEKSMDKNEAMSALNALSTKIDSLKDAVRALADKLDANAAAVTGLENDYRVEVNSKIQ